MSRTVSLRCRCGALRGSVANVTPAADSRAVCYCDDCQIYALHLGTSGVLDERGGTDVCMVAPAQVKLSDGQDQLRCLQLGPKGPFRFYAGCCNTPLVNMVGPRLPILMVVHACMDHAAGGRTRDEDVGPARVRVMGRFAKGGAPQGVHPKVPFGKVVPDLLGFLARTWLRGHGNPSPFLDEQGKPRAQPTLIDKDAREVLRARVHAAANL